ncbi:MAG TPA: alpha/beta hydrolase, partial [Acidimicrobiales bacterium]|nr:alpha/beta hydrolase [Acidimicrobiales bacterium]
MNGSEPLAYGRRLSVAAGAVAAAVLLAACSQTAGAAKDTTTSSAPATSSTTTTSSTLAAGAVSIVKAPVRVADTTDGLVGYRQVGAGPPLLMIMGYSGTMDDWEPNFIDALAREHTVVIFDNAGIGMTSGLKGTLTVTAMARQTAALIQCLHLGSPEVLGWSMGTMIAQALTVLYPTLVSRLVLCASYPGNGKGKLPSASASEALSHSTKSDAGSLLGLLFPANQKAALDFYVHEISLFPHFYVSSAAVQKAQLGALVSWLFGKETAGHGVSQISVPTLIADGSADDLDPT